MMKMVGVTKFLTIKVLNYCNLDLRSIFLFVFFWFVLV